MIYKHNNRGMNVIMCHDLYFTRIHELMESLKILEYQENINEGSEHLYWSRRTAIDILRSEIWHIFTEIEAQRAKYSDAEWHEMYDRHKKQREEHPVTGMPLDTEDND